ncbi:MAG: M48 family metallopeptidase [Candidatus Pacebacteria bacterium]|nr:M48 family metallopeptidase [Candidatus Paceibacterota bacterium]
MAGAKEIKNKSHYPELWNITENLCITAGLKMPKLYIINDNAPNAFATGRNEEHAVVAVTQGLLNILNKSELEAVIAHELSHIGNKDMLLQTAVVVISGAIAVLADIFLRVSMFGNDRENKSPVIIIIAVLASILLPIAATIVQLAISRKREFLADTSAVLLTRYPEAMANALLKISNSPVELRHQNPAMNHIYFFDPVKGLNGEGDSNKVS